MDSYEYGELLKELEIKRQNIEKIMQPSQLQSRIEEIESLEQQKEFWEDSKKAGEYQKEKKRCLRQLEKYKEANLALSDAKELFELSSDDEETLNELFNEAPMLEEQIKKAEIEVMLSGELDSNNAIFTITPGAGGTESQDWASMLYRMYLRY